MRPRGQRLRCVEAVQKVAAVGHADHALELFETADPVAVLPAPVVPFGGRGVGVEAAIEGPRVAVDGEAEGFLPGGGLERRRGKKGRRIGFSDGGRKRYAPRWRTKITSSQELEIHRCLMTLFKPDLDAPYGNAHQTVQRRIHF